MSEFTRPLTVTKIIEDVDKKFLWFKWRGKKHYWIVDRSFSYAVGDENSEDVILVIKGTKTDFASVPQFLWWIFPPDGVYTQACVLHDKMCVHPDRSQRAIDLVFLEAMEVLGVVKWRRKAMYEGVKAYQMHKKRKARKDYG